MSKTYFVTGGGTGGHIYPAVAIVNELLNSGVKKEEIYYLGNKNNLEYEIATKNGYNFLSYNSKGMPRKIGFALLSWAFQIIMASFKALQYVIKYKPSVVFATGGYVCAPILICARLLNLLPFLCLNISNTNKINPFVSTFLLLNSITMGSFLFLKLTKTFSQTFLSYKNAIIVFLLASLFYYVFASFKNKNIVKKLTYLFASNLAIALLFAQNKEEIFILYLFCLILSYSFCYFFSFILQRKFKSLDIAVLKKIDIKSKSLKII